MSGGRIIVEMLLAAHPRHFRGNECHKMPTYAALFLLCAAASSAARSPAVCDNPVQCPCGGKNFTICLEPPFTDHPCRKWEGCKSCQDGLTECLECPDGLEGPFCTKVKLSRQKRQSGFFSRREYQIRRPAEGGCRDLNTPKLGSMECSTISSRRSVVIESEPDVTSDLFTYMRGQQGNNGGYSPQAHEFEKTCTLTCPPGYTFENMGSKTQIQLRCENGDWTPMMNFPPCTSGGYCDLEVVGHGSFNCTTGMHGTRCDVRCSDQYVGQYSCYPGQSWEPPLPRCLRRKGSGDAIPAPRCRCEYGGSCDRNGNCICPVGRTGTFCQYQRRTCPDPGLIANGRRSNMDGRPFIRRRFEDGEYVQFRCDAGENALRGSAFLDCNDGEWSDPPPKCIERRPCSDPGFIANGYRLNMDGMQSTTRRMFEDREYVKFGCNADEDELSGLAFLDCNDGRWSRDLPRCIKTAAVSDREVMYCDSPDPIWNGRVNPILPYGSEDYVSGTDNIHEYPEGTRLEYTCEEGYSLIGTSMLDCKSSGHWSSESPKCSTDCGIFSMKNSLRVINGVKTEVGEWPWVVAIASLQNNVSKIICGGAVIDSRTVVTAAHCLETDPLILYFGKLHRSDKNDDTKVMRRQSTQIIRHPDFNSSILDSDIGLIVFPAIRFTDRVKPICLPSHESTAMNLMTGVKGYVTGWGETEHSLPADRLMQAELPYLSNEDCLEAHRRHVQKLDITRNTFCAGYKDGQQSACIGDSGSPLVFFDKQKHRFILEGLVSFGLEGQCGMPERYTVFTKVSLFAPWIMRNILYP